MKLLYVSPVHPTLETCNCITWSDLEIEWYSTGYFAVKNGLGDLPKIKNYYANDKYRKELMKNANAVDMVDLLKERYLTYTTKIMPHIWTFNKNFVDKFDIFIFSHDIANVVNNLEVLKNKKVIFNSYGMHSPASEIQIGSLRALKKIIRTSTSLHEDRFTPLYGGVDKVIHTSVIPNDEVYKWNGKKDQICIFCNGFQVCENRRKYYEKILSLCPNYKFLLYGANNEQDPLSCGFCSLNEKIEIINDSRISLIVGTPGSSYTYSLAESMIAGSPTVCYGKEMWESKVYEIDELFNHGEDILIGETPEECADYIQLLMKDKELCEYLGRNARQKALKVFGRKAVAKEWKDLFNDI